ncbi:SPOR domain-containing protein [Marinilabiliaceae bacterium ANBcel2]|nr:SPOR domain-containing protein [Marinilabiliaceae bacterium ANBcel2]
MKAYILIMIFALMLTSACKNRTKEDAVTAEQVTIEPETQDTATALPEPEPEPEPEPKITEEEKDDKYFLIAGSFLKHSNAEALQKELSQKGFNSQIIKRDYGPNQEFHKVSYMSFDVWNLALQQLTKDRAEEETDDVWILVKK